MRPATSRIRRRVFAGMLAAALAAFARPSAGEMPEPIPPSPPGQAAESLVPSAPVPFAGPATEPIPPPPDPLARLPSVEPFVPGRVDDQPPVPPPPQPDGEFSADLPGQIVIEPYYPDPRATLLPIPPDLPPLPELPKPPRRDPYTAPLWSGCGFEWALLEPRGDSVACGNLDATSGFRIWLDLPIDHAEDPVSSGFQARLFLLKTPSQKVGNGSHANDGSFDMEDVNWFLVDVLVDLFADDDDEEDDPFGQDPEADEEVRSLVPADGLTAVWFDLAPSRVWRHGNRAATSLSAGLRIGAWSRRTLGTAALPGSRYDFLGAGPVVAYEGYFRCTRVLSLYGQARGAILLGEGERSGYPTGSVVESFDPLGVLELQGGLQLTYHGSQGFAYARIGAEVQWIHAGGDAVDPALVGWMLGFGFGF